MTRKSVEENKIWGLEVNVPKIEYMCIGGPQPDLSSGQTIKQWSVYEYLGIKITKDET